MSEIEVSAIAFFVLVVVFALVRNDWVYKTRVSSIFSGNYHKLPTYNQMVLRFWVWDVNKFIDGGRDE